MTLAFFSDINFILFFGVFLNFQQCLQIQALGYSAAPVLRISDPIL